MSRTALGEPLLHGYFKLRKFPFFGRVRARSLSVLRIDATAIHQILFITIFVRLHVLKCETYVHLSLNTNAALSRAVHVQRRHERFDGCEKETTYWVACIWITSCSHQRLDDVSVAIAVMSDDMESRFAPLCDDQSTHFNQHRANRYRAQLTTTFTKMNRHVT